MNRRTFLTTVGLLAASGAVATAARRQGARAPRIVTTKDAAYLLGAVEPVLAGKIAEVSAAPGGRWVLATQDLRPESTADNPKPYGEQKLWLYDALRRKLTLLHRIQDDPNTGARAIFTGATWFPTTKKALVSVTAFQSTNGKLTERNTQGLVDIERASVRWLSLPLSQPTVMVEPVSGTGLLLLQGIGFDTGLKNQTKQVTFLTPEGSCGPVITLAGMARLSGLSADGKSAIFDELILRRNDAERKLLQEHQWHSVRLSDAQVTTLKEKPKDLVTRKELSKAPALPLQLLRDNAKLTGSAGRDATTNALWLEPVVPGAEKKYARALVTAEADWNTVLLADLSAVIYTHDAALYASPIVSLDRVAFEKLQRELAMSHAKQVGLGLMMYAQDYDENFPHDPSSVKDAILPYLKNREILADFVYTYTGPTNLNKIDTPSTTPLGYIPVPGGRMVVYADGHVKLGA